MENLKNFIDKNKKYLNFKEVADFFGVTERSIRFKINGERGGADNAEKDGRHSDNRLEILEACIENIKDNMELNSSIIKDGLKQVKKLQNKPV